MPTRLQSYALRELLLAYCCNVPVSLGTLYRGDIDEVLNMPHHHCNAEELRRELQRLIDAGLMTATTRSEEGVAPQYRTLTHIPAAGELNQEVANEIFLELTPAGGTEWEKYAAPEWRLFVAEDSPRIIGGEVHLIFRSVTRATTNVLRDLVAYWDDIPVADQTVKKLGRWHALYWKDFPAGYELRMNTHTVGESRMGQLYLGGTADVEGRLAEIVKYMTSLWDLGFRLQLTKRGSTMRNKFQ